MGPSHRPTSLYLLSIVTLASISTSVVRTCAVRWSGLTSQGDIVLDRPRWPSFWRGGGGVRGNCSLNLHPRVGVGVGWRAPGQFSNSVYPRYVEAGIKVPKYRGGGGGPEASFNTPSQVSEYPL